MVFPRYMDLGAHGRCASQVSFQVVTIDEKGHFKHTHEAYEYAYPFPVYIVFDPWNPEDKKVYCPDEV
jgi:hypothetical protein